MRRLVEPAPRNVALPIRVPSIPRFEPDRQTASYAMEIL